MHMRLCSVQKKIWHRKPMQKFVNIDVSTLGRRVGIHTPSFHNSKPQGMQDIGVKRYGRRGFQSAFDTLMKKNCNKTRVDFKKLK